MSQRIIDIVKDRTVGILGSGKSLLNLGERINKPCYDNICWVAINAIEQINDLLKPRKIEMAVLFERATYRKQRQYLLKNRDFLLIAKIEERGNVFNPYADERFTVDKLKLAHSSSFFIYILNTLGIEDIYLFGLDGGGAYFADIKIFSEEDSQQRYDTEEFVFCRESNLKCTNVNTGSKYPFKEISYNQFEER